MYVIYLRYFAAMGWIGPSMTSMIESTKLGDGLNNPGSPIASDTLQVWNIKRAIQTMIRATYNPKTSRHQKSQHRLG